MLDEYVGAVIKRLAKYKNLKLKKRERNRKRVKCRLLIHSYI
jgi:hypothetical protein